MPLAILGAAVTIVAWCLPALLILQPLVLLSGSPVLRDIVRGISPAVLVDRGLTPAVSAVAARAAIPVTVTADIPERPDPTIEGIAYYLVCEALGTATRHAAASAVQITLIRREDRLVVEVRDDGRGGADPEGGTGLHGHAGGAASSARPWSSCCRWRGRTEYRSTTWSRHRPPATRASTCGRSGDPD